jgi:transposase-like protein
MDIFSAPHFRDDTEARKFLERLLWPDGPVCPHCGTFNRAYATKRPGVYRCAEKLCRKDFTVTMKTVMERSHIALHKWLQAFHLMTSSKKGVSAHQLHRTLAITYEAAWFMAHRIRECMRSGGLAPMGGAGEVVEIDETLSGKIEGAPKRMHPGSGWQFRNVVLSLVERGGSVRSFHVDGTTIATLLPIIRANVNRETAVVTDEASWYKNLKREGAFTSHDSVNHTAKEYVRYGTERTIHTNTVEGYFSIFKRGMKGIYQHCSEKHLHRYLSEFDFRYNHRTALGFDDPERAALAVKGAAGKRLTYRQPHKTEEAEDIPF